MVGRESSECIGRSSYSACYSYPGWRFGLGAGQLSVLAEPVLKGEADLTIAAFHPVKNAGGFGFVKGLARFGLRLLAGQQFDAPLSGQRVMRRPGSGCGSSFTSGYGVEVAMTIAAAREGVSYPGGSYNDEPSCHR